MQTRHSFTFLLSYALTLGLLLSTGANAYAESLLNDPNNPTPANHHKILSPMFTGPLITPSAHVASPKAANIEPYMFFHFRPGHYDSNGDYKSKSNGISYHLMLSGMVGVFKNTDFKFGWGMQANVHDGNKAFGVDDLMLGFEVSLHNDGPGDPYPALKLAISESFPIGAYNNLDAVKAPPASNWQWRICHQYNAGNLQACASEPQSLSGSTFGLQCHFIVASVC